MRDRGKTVDGQGGKKQKRGTLRNAARRETGEPDGPYFLDGGAPIYSALSRYFSPGNSKSITHLRRCWLLSQLL